MLKNCNFAITTDNERKQKETSSKIRHQSIGETAKKRVLNTSNKLYGRSHSNLNAATLKKRKNPQNYNQQIQLRTDCDGIVHVTRTQSEKDKDPDRICLDRRGLANFPFIENESRLRLLSLQHNLLTNLTTIGKQKFENLVFLDLYGNQLEQIKSIEFLENIRILLMGKNRIRKIEGFDKLNKLEILDLHGNQITQIDGLENLSQLKVLNLAANRIKLIDINDLSGLKSLKELNLRSNRLRKLLINENLNLIKLFLSNNDLQRVDDISSIIKSHNIEEISIENNPVFLKGDCVPFLVSYLPRLAKLNATQITEQVKKAAMAWRRNKEASNSILTNENKPNFKREEIISNARTNWELIRSQSKCLMNTDSLINKTINPDLTLTSISSKVIPKKKCAKKIAIKVPLLPSKSHSSSYMKLSRDMSQETECSLNTTFSTASTSTSTATDEYLKLPPILLPIINKLEKTNINKDDGCSLYSLGPNIDSSCSTIADNAQASSASTKVALNSDYEEDEDCDSPSMNSSSSSDYLNDELSDKEEYENTKKVMVVEIKEQMIHEKKDEMVVTKKKSSKSTVQESSTCDSFTTNLSTSSTSTSSNVEKMNRLRTVKSATSLSQTRKLSLPSKLNPSITMSNANMGHRAATAKLRKTPPTPPCDREQGGDYLIEICGRYLNIYGQSALRFIDHRTWNQNKANDVTHVNFNYVNFNVIVGYLNKIKLRFPNADFYTFKETNIYCLGQLNAISETLGLVSLTIEADGNAICQNSNWRSYAIYRLAHWGLKTINGIEINKDELESANAEYQSLSDLVLWCLPDVLLQPLVSKLRITKIPDEDAKKWLLNVDSELRSVVCKEALQWKKNSLGQDDALMKQKATGHILHLLNETTDSIKKLRKLTCEWPQIMHDFVQNTLLDYTQYDMYIKRKLQELNK